MINSKHPDYTNNIERWVKNRDFAEGEDAVKSKQTTYLPRIGKPDALGTYRKYLERAIFYGCVSKTVNALVGILYRKAPQINVDNGDEFVKDTSLSVFLQKMAAELFLVGRYGVLVDMEQEPSNQAFFVGYEAEQIINWYEHHGELVRVVLQTSEFMPDINDPYELKEVFKIRELVLEEGVYKQKLYISTDPSGGFELLEELIPTNRGRSMDFIPFVFVNQFDTDINITKAPLTDLVNLNNHHYMKSADYSNALHLVGLPTPYATGVPYDPDKTWYLGSENIVTFEETGSTFGFAEVSGAGFGALKTAIDDIEENMAKVGARLMFGPRPGVETAEATRLNQSAENAGLNTVAVSIETAMTEVFIIALEWMNANSNVEFDINKDFVDTKISAQDLQVLLQAWQSGAMSLDSLLHNIKQGELLPEDRTIEDEKEFIEQQL